MGWLGIDPHSIHDIFITHQDTDHVGAVEEDSPGLFRSARLYWHRTKTLGRGDDCCDFCLRIREEEK